MIFIILKNSVLEHNKNKYIVLYNSKISIYLCLPEMIKDHITMSEINQTINLHVSVDCVLIGF